MATPISAAFSEGASFTPSPVMATKCRWRCSALTIRSFCSGDTRAYTRTFSTTSSKASEDIASNSRPLTTRSPGLSSPISLATAAAVAGWSPVIITVCMPAAWHSAMASLTSGLAGSFSPTRPANTSSRSSSSAVNRSGSVERMRYPKAMTRMPSAAMACASRWTASTEFAVARDSSRDSVAPFVTARYPPDT